MHVLSDSSFKFGDARVVRTDKNTHRGVGNYSAARRKYHLERDKFEVPRLRIPRQSRRDLGAVSRDAHRQHHLHGYDEGIGGC